MSISKTAMAGLAALAVGVVAVGVAQAHGDGYRDRDGGMFGGRHHGMGGSQRLGALFDLLDVDGDDAVSLAEGLRVPQRAFARLDTNGDGFVDEDEFGAARDERDGRFLARRFDRLDANNDDKVSGAEYEVRVRGHFDVADADNDGKVTRAEFDEAMSTARSFMHRFGRFGHRRSEAEPTQRTN